MGERKGGGVEHEAGLSGGGLGLGFPSVVFLSLLYWAALGIGLGFFFHGCFLLFFSLSREREYGFCYQGGGVAFSVDNGLLPLYNLGELQAQST